MTQRHEITIWLLMYLSTLTWAYNDNSKFLGNDINEEYRHGHGGRRRRPNNQGANNPCQFGGAGGFGKPKAEGTGRTFFDLQYYNLEHNYHVNVNCGGGHPGAIIPVHPAPATGVGAIAIASDHGGQKPLSGHRPLGGHKPLGGQRPFGGLGGHGGGGHKPWGGGGVFGGGNRPHQGGSYGPGNQDQGGNGGGLGPVAGAFSSAFAGILPSPQQFATGFSDGLQSFVGTIPAIAQSFQSILPNFGNFQLPQFNPGANTGPVTFRPPFQGGSFNNPVNRPTTTPTVAPPLTATTDPDDIIYSDQIRPVHEDHDPITEPYTSNGHKRPTGGNMWYYPDGRPYYPTDDRRTGSSRYSHRGFPEEQSNDRSQTRSLRFPLT